MYCLKEKWLVESWPINAATAFTGGIRRPGCYIVFLEEQKLIVFFSPVTSDKGPLVTLESVYFMGTET